MSPNIPADWDPEDVAEWEAMQKKKRREQDPDWQEYKREMDAAWRKPSPEEQEEIDIRAQEKSEAQEAYGGLRDNIANAMANSGITDFELFGAGKYGENLSPLEYQGALRVIGPRDPEQADNFVRTVENIAIPGGYQVEMDRPPSVTHAFGQTIRGGVGLEGRPILYIYKRYRAGWPSEAEREMAGKANVSRDEMARLYGSTRLYESRMAEIADDITADPNSFVCPGETLATRIGTVPEFKLLREEINDAARHSIDLKRSIHLPLGIGSPRRMIYFLADASKGNVSIDILGCPQEIVKKAIAPLSQMMCV